MSDIYNRVERLVGEDIMNIFAEKRVIIFGVGGVGSWCAEGLVRSGVTNLTIVDSDRVSVTNVNRQVMATTKTVGQVKVDAMKAHLLAINPDAHITAVQAIYSAETSSQFDLDSYDYIVDAIDSLKDKAQLILDATASKAKFFCSLGAALKVDPTRIKVAEFWNVKGCPLGAALRKKFNRSEIFPSKKFLCVYDDEVLPNRGECLPIVNEFKTSEGEPSLADHDWNASKAQINGTLAHITSIFGMTLSGLILKDIYTSALKAN